MAFLEPATEVAEARNSQSNEISASGFCCIHRGSPPPVRKWVLVDDQGGDLCLTVFMTITALAMTMEHILRKLESRRMRGFNDGRNKTEFADLS